MSSRLVRALCAVLSLAVSLLYGFRWMGSSPAADGKDAGQTTNLVLFLACLGLAAIFAHMALRKAKA